MFFWVIVICHAEWTDCTYGPQPTQGVCLGQAEQINLNTDSVALCTTYDDNAVRAPEAWAITTEERQP